MGPSAADVVIDISGYFAPRSVSVLTFLAQDAEGHAFCYANADLRKGQEADEILRFIAF